MREPRLPLPTLVWRPAKTPALRPRRMRSRSPPAGVRCTWKDASVLPGWSAARKVRLRDLCARRSSLRPPRHVHGSPTPEEGAQLLGAGGERRQRGRRCGRAAVSREVALQCRRPRACAAKPGSDTRSGLRSGPASACAHRLLQTSAERSGTAWAGECEVLGPSLSLHCCGALRLSADLALFALNIPDPIGAADHRGTLGKSKPFTQLGVAVHS